ncbi:hypothetical protein RSK20926_12284 [Roseobacter sp. SK209-2-6]|uniref:hypothetical protein n=1 Tax=Roseobacter sp. SK209-2-6 TaxID=388739 RepID=UPI0000F3C7B7|nr:hypothetical protein [Roseobacter sp. SK209-2-6]EBA18498.1 hypothetical protein RSK20926_12284 [Roseobacter sp. SK209-2-6]
MTKLRHKQVWTWWLQKVGAELAEQDYAPHPVYVAGWEPGNQMYQAEFILGFSKDGLRQVQVHYIPSAKQLGVIAFHYWCHDSAQRFGNIRQAGDWTDQTLQLPWRQLDIRDALRGWNLLRYTNKVKFDQSGEAVNLEKIWHRHQQPLADLLLRLAEVAHDASGFRPPLLSAEE